MLALTVGAGVKNPRGELRTIESTVEAYAGMLASLPKGTEVYWSPNTFKGNHRITGGWLSSSAIAIDVDWHVKKEDPAPEAVARLLVLLRCGGMHGNIAHLTPHGLRVIFVLTGNCVDPVVYKRASVNVGRLVQASLDLAGLEYYRVDEPIVEDLARFFFAPTTIAKGKPREAEIIAMRSAAHDIIELAGPEKTAVPNGKSSTGPAALSAIDRWIMANPMEYPRSGGTCPMCKHNDCFGHLPDDPTKWYCFSTDHGNAGREAVGGGHYGDAMDIAMVERGMSAAEILRKDGFTKLGSITPISKTMLRSGTYNSIYDIISQNRNDVLQGRALRLNLMTGFTELGTELICDVDISVIRRLVEVRFLAGVDQQGITKGMVFRDPEIRSACNDVAKENAYHPVRDYLNGLVWDSVPRIRHIPDDILGAERSALNIAIFHRWTISAVARAMVPGCKMDTMLVLVGAQGTLKSTFVEVMASTPWYNSTPANLKEKDAFQALRGKWICEMAELESLKRSADSAVIKAFLSSSVDTYRPSYGRYVESVGRDNIMVGTSNPTEFLTDETGNRRFWPITVGAIDIDAAREQRDQIWAEAVQLYRAGTTWWLSEDEKTLLDERHADHMVSDVWEEYVAPYCAARNEVTVAEVLTHAITRDKDKQDPSAKHRVCAILKGLGFKSHRTMTRRFWTRS